MNKDINQKEDQSQEISDLFIKEENLKQIIKTASEKTHKKEEFIYESIPQQINQEINVKQAYKKNNTKYFQYALLIILLLIPVMPKQVGGEIEISGASGENQITMRPPIDAIVSEIFVKTNDKVLEGQEIVQLTNWNLDEKLIEVQQRLEKAKANFETLSAQFSSGESEYRQSLEAQKKQQFETIYLQKQSNRQSSSKIEITEKQLEQAKLRAESLEQEANLHKDLANKGVFPKQSALKSQYQAEAAKKEVEALTSQLEVEKNEILLNSNKSAPALREVEEVGNSNLAKTNIIRSQMKELLIQIKWLYEELDFYNKQKEALLLRAPISGTILTMGLENLKGQHLNPGDSVITIGNLNKVNVVIQLPEEQRTFIRKGDKVVVRIKALKGKRFKGIVESISPIIINQEKSLTTKKIWQIKMSLDNNQNTLSPGMTGFAKIHSSKKNSILGSVFDEIYSTFQLDRYI